MKGLILLTIFGIAFAAPSERLTTSCKVCVLLVDEVRELLTISQTKDTVLNYVGGACTHLEGEDKSVCKLLVDQYSANLLQNAASHLTSRQFCNQLPDVCTSEEPPTSIERPPIIEESVGIEEETQPQGLLECELCKLLVVGVDKLINTNKSVAAINDTLEKLCASLPEKLAPACKDIEPKIIDAIQNGVPPDTACKLAALCATGNDYSSHHVSCDACVGAMDAIRVEDPRGMCLEAGSCVREVSIELPEPQTNTVLQSETEVEDTIECQLCKFAVQAIDTVVGQNKTAATINETLYEFCNQLPGELKDACLNTEPDILKAILGGVDPSKACDFIKACQDTSSVKLSDQYVPCGACIEVMDSLAGEEGVELCFHMYDGCKGYEKPTAVQMKEEIGDDAKCELCKFVITLLDEVLETNSSVAYINATLYEICKALPQELQQICTSLVPQIDTIVATGFDPNATCVAVAFCTADQETVPFLTCEACNSLTESILPSDEVESVGSALCSASCHHRNRRSIADMMEYWTSEADTIQQYITDYDNIDANLIECEICKVMIRLVDDIAGQNATVSTVNATLQEICNRLSGQQLVDICLQETPKLVALMQNGVEPNQVCAMAKLCDAAVVEEQADPVPQQLEISAAEEEPNDLMCDLCKELVQFVDSRLQDNATDEKINETLYQVCTGLPSTALQDICLSQIPAIMKVVDNGGYDPEKACEAANLCTSGMGEKTNMLKESVLSAPIETITVDEPNDEKCDLCKELVQFVDSYLKDNATDEKVNATLYQVCSGLPSPLQDICLSQIPAIMKVVNEGGLDPEKACVAAQLCAEGMVSKKTNYLKNGESSVIKEKGNLKDLKCEICKAVVDEIDSVLGENTTVAKLNETVYNVCEELQGSLQDICLQVAPQLIQVVAGGVDYKLACGIIGLCPKAQDKDDLKTSLPENRVAPVIDGNGNLKDLKCSICKAVIDELDAVLAENSTVAKLNETVFGLCNNLQGALQDICNLLAPELVSVISAGVDYKLACGAIGLCPKSEDKVQIKPILLKNSAVPVLKDDGNLKDLKCDICKVIIDDLDATLAANATVARINETVFGLCNNLEGALKGICNLLAPSLVSAISSGVDYKVACGAIGLCPKTQDKVEIKPILLKERALQVMKDDGNLKDLKCDICKVIIDDLDATLAANATVARINETVFGLCNNLEGALRGICNLLAPSLVSAISSGVDYKVACGAIGLCPKTQDKVEIKPILLKERALQVMKDDGNLKDLKCDICKVIIDDLDATLAANATVARINETVFGLCNNLEGALKGICNLLAPSLVSAISSGVDYKVACGAIGLCPKTQDFVLEDEPMFKEAKPLMCDDCARSMQLIYSDLETDYPKVKPSLKQLCNNLPEDYIYMCEEFVSEDKGSYLKTFLQQFNPEVLCDAAGCQ